MLYLRATDGLDRSFSIYLAKFFAFIAMHLNTFSQFSRSMNIMKYVANHPSRFDYQYNAFALGLAEMILTFLYLLLKAIIMFTRANVYFAMLSYGTVSIIVNLSDKYLAQILADHNN